MNKTASKNLNKEIKRIIGESDPSVGMYVKPMKWNLLRSMLVAVDAYVLSLGGSYQDEAHKNMLRVYNDCVNAGLLK